MLLYLKDFQAELKMRYKELVVDAIRNEIYEGKDHNTLLACIGSLLSLLIHEGHSIEELFSIIRNIFIVNKSRQPYSFDDNFKFATGIISRTPSRYDIIPIFQQIA
jgi:hypothetical protein